METPEALYLGLSLNSKHNTKSFGGSNWWKGERDADLLQAFPYFKGKSLHSYRSFIIQPPHILFVPFPISSKVSALIDQLYSNFFLEGQKG